MTPDGLADEGGRGRQTAPRLRSVWSGIFDDRADCLIVANGSAPGRHLLRSASAHASRVIAVDGALATVLSAGVLPDYVVGDFDSVDEAALARVPIQARVYVPDQDRCDLEKALELAVQLDCRTAVILGGLGGRVDHSLTTVSLLLKYAERIQLRHLDATAEVIPVFARTVVHGAVGQTLSLIAMAPVHGVTLTGVRWPLEDADVEPGSLGVSNVMTQREAHVSVRKGVLLICRMLKTP